MACRKIASNLLWTPQGVVRDPLVEIAADGRMRSLAVCAEPDRMPFVEFYAGLLVFDFPADFRAAFAALQDTPDESLAERLPGLVVPGGGIPVVISGLDYASLRLTPAATIRKI
ncbi:MAG: cytosine deaminase [Alistipes sp.]|nr:cytosine deaminase [Alistipes sp.]